VSRSTSPSVPQLVVLAVLAEVAGLGLVALGSGLLRALGAVLLVAALGALALAGRAAARG